MNTGLIASRYAKALLLYAFEEHVEETVYHEMTNVLNSFRQLPQIRSVLGNPVTKNADTVWFTGTTWYAYLIPITYYIEYHLGTVDAVIQSVALGGEDADSFNLSSGQGLRLKAGQADDSTWTLRPIRDLKAGTYKASVIFTLDTGETVELDFQLTVN